MGRQPTKAADNPWCQARLKAATWNEKLASRAGAAEAIGMSEDAIRNTELGLEKCMPVEKAVLLADLYNAPELKNLFCREYCPIGSELPLSERINSIERIVVKLLLNFEPEKTEKMRKVLLEIASDGNITQDEVVKLDSVIAYFNRISKTVSELKTLNEKVKHGQGIG